MRAVVGLLVVVAILQSGVLGALAYREFTRPTLAQTICQDALDRRRQAERIMLTPPVVPVMNSIDSYAYWSRAWTSFSRTTRMADDVDRQILMDIQNFCRW